MNNKSVLSTSSKCQVKYLFTSRQCMLILDSDFSTMYSFHLFTMPNFRKINIVSIHNNIIFDGILKKLVPTEKTNP